MLEYASMRLRLVWAMAATFPHTSVNRRERPQQGVPPVGHGRKRHEEYPHQGGHGRELDGHGHEARNRRRRARVGVGQPHVERRERQLEPEARDEKNEARKIITGFCAMAAPPSPENAAAIPRIEVVPVNP